MNKREKLATFKGSKSKWILQRVIAGHGCKWWKLRKAKG